jgi:hypothetical protein
VAPGSSDPNAGPSDPLLDAQVGVELMAVEQSPAGRHQLNLGGGGAGGGYALNPDQLRDLVKQWHDILDRARRYDAEIALIRATGSAAADDASGGFTAGVRNLGIGLKASHDSLTGYIGSYIAKIDGARVRYDDAERGVESALTGL